MYAGEAVVLVRLGTLLRPRRRLGGAGDRLRRWDTDCAMGRGGGSSRADSNGGLLLTKEMLVDQSQKGARLRSNAEAIANNRCLAALPNPFPGNPIGLQVRSLSRR